MGNGHVDSSKVVSKVGKSLLVDMGRCPVTSWMEEAALMNQVSEEPSGTLNVKCCRTDPQWFCWNGHPVDGSASISGECQNDMPCPPCSRFGSFITAGNPISLPRHNKYPGTRERVSSHARVVDESFSLGGQQGKVRRF